MSFPPSPLAAEPVQAHPRPVIWSALSAFRLPIIAFLVLLALLAFIPYRYVTPGQNSALQILSHHLGHEINSIWVGIGLILIILPSYQAVRKGLYDGWAWRAIDAIVLDFLIIDAVCRRFLDWPRPGTTDSPGFPSGHATFAFLISWLVWRRYPKLGPAWFAMAALIGWSRFAVNAHYPYQIIAGALLGCGLGSLVAGRKQGVLLPRIFLKEAAGRPPQRQTPLQADSVGP